MPCFSVSPSCSVFATYSTDVDCTEFNATTDYSAGERSYAWTLPVGGTYVGGFCSSAWLALASEEQDLEGEYTFRWCYQHFTGHFYSACHRSNGAQLRCSHRADARCTQYGHMALSMGHGQHTSEQQQSNIRQDDHRIEFLGRGLTNRRLGQMIVIDADEFRSDSILLFSGYTCSHRLFHSFFLSSTPFFFFSLHRGTPIGLINSAVDNPSTGFSPQHSEPFPHLSLSLAAPSIIFSFDRRSPCPAVTTIPTTTTTLSSVSPISPKDLESTCQ